MAGGGAFLAIDLETMLWSEGTGALIINGARREVGWEPGGGEGGGKEKVGVGGVLSMCMAVVVWPWTLAPLQCHVGFSPTRQALLAPSAKRREEFGELHEG